MIGTEKTHDEIREQSRAKYLRTTASGGFQILPVGIDERVLTSDTDYYSVVHGPSLHASTQDDFKMLRFKRFERQ